MGGEGGRHLDASVSCPRATQGQAPNRCPLGAQLQAELGARQARLPWSPRPLWKPTEDSPTLPAVEKGLCQVTTTRGAREGGLGLKAQGAQSLALSGTGREGHGPAERAPRTAQPLCSLPPRAASVSAQRSPCHCCASGPWPARCSLAGPAAARASVHVRVSTRIGTHARHSHTRARAHTHRLQAPIVSTVAPAPAPGARPRASAPLAPTPTGIAGSRPLPNPM